jgi:aminoglycoside phosphotransferase (APT) family kinase protein
MADQLAGMSAQQARFSLERLAAAQMQWWDAADLGELTWLPLFSDAIVKQMVRVYRDRWPDFVDLHAGYLPPGARRLGECIGVQLERLLDELSRPPVTVVHGDFRAENLLFGSAGYLDAVAVIDWQICGRGRGAFDMAYLLCQSMTVADRRDHEIDIITGWHNALVLGGLRGYSFVDVLGDYRRAALLCIAWAVVGAALERPAGRARLLERAKAVRSFTAAIDLQAGALIGVR